MEEIEYSYNNIRMEYDELYNTADNLIDEIDKKELENIENISISSQ